MNWNITTIQFYSFSIFSDGLRKWSIIMLLQRIQNLCTRVTFVFYALSNQNVWQTIHTNFIGDKNHGKGMEINWSHFVGIQVWLGGTHEMVIYKWGDSYSRCFKILDRDKVTKSLRDTRHIVHWRSFNLPQHFWCLTKLFWLIRWNINFLLCLPQSFPCLILREKKMEKTNIWDRRQNLEGSWLKTPIFI
jgi:hypothetical protein